MYLENNLCNGLFHNSQVGLLQVLTSQMAISLENIHYLHDQMEKQTQQIMYVFLFLLFKFLFLPLHSCSRFFSPFFAFI